MKIYPISRLMSKAFIIHVKSWINTSIVLYLLSGSSKAGQVWERGMSQWDSVPSPQGANMGAEPGSGIGIYQQPPPPTPPASDELGPGATTGVPPAAKANGTRDRLQWGSKFQPCERARNVCPQHHWGRDWWSQTEIKRFSWAVGNSSEGKQRH